MNREPPYSYPDQLLKDFVEYSDQISRGAQETVYAKATGFQDLVGRETSNTRTRAKEMFDLGLLRGVLITPQGSPRETYPLGWQFARSQTGFQTRLGYFAYAIGQAISHGAIEQDIQRAFNCLCALFLLQIGFVQDGVFVLTSSIYKYVLHTYQTTPPTRSIDWYRRVATVFFSTLKDDPGRSYLLDKYIHRRPITELFVEERGSPRASISADALLTARNLANVSPPKPGLFWIGDVNSSFGEARGLYTRGATDAGSLLDLVSDMERDHIQKGLESPYRALNEKPTDTEMFCVVEKLYQISSTEPGLRSVVESVMQTIYQGVVKSLQFVADSQPLKQPRVFYAHDVDESQLVPELMLEVPLADCFLEPKVDDIVEMRGKRYGINKVETTNGVCRLQLQQTR